MKQKKEQRYKQWKEKQLHGKFIRETEEVRSEETWGWIRKGYLKKETEGLIFAAQEQVLWTNWITKNIDGQEVSEKFRMCGERDESITHLVAECKKLAQKECKQRHDNIARIVHLELCQKFGLVGNVKWYNHKPVSAVENDRVKILWDFNIQTDHVIQHRRPDIVVLYKNKRMSPYWYCCAWGQKDWVERTGKDRQLHRIKTGSEKDLELVSSCGCSSCNWSAGSDIEKTERLTGEVKRKE